MASNDKNPLNLLLPAGVVAYAASPQVRKAVRSAVVKGMAGVMDLVDRAESATTGLRGQFETIVSDADKLRKDQAGPAVKVEVEDAEEPPAGAEGAPA